MMNKPSCNIIGCKTLATKWYIHHPEWIYIWEDWVSEGNKII